MSRTSERRSAALPRAGLEEEADFGRPAPIDEDVEGELNAALPDPPTDEDENLPESS
jgi:hypothetical protein